MSDPDVDLDLEYDEYVSRALRGADEDWATCDETRATRALIEVAGVCRQVVDPAESLDLVRRIICRMIDESADRHVEAVAERWK